MDDERARPPGDYIKDELRHRSWTQADLALITNRSITVINEIVQAKRPITPEIAVELGIAFDTSPSIWLGREAMYRLSMLSIGDEETKRRARLLQIAPIKEMEKRGWIRASNSIAELEAELCRFFQIESINEEPQIQAAAKQTFKSHELTPPQRAWVFRAAQLAHLLHAATFSEERLAETLGTIRRLAAVAEKVHHIPRLLAQAGVRLVIVEPLPRSRIDGAAFWMEEGPIVVLSLRYDRIDAFWHTLLHELIHIKYGDSRSLDSDLVGESKAELHDAIEERAEREGAEFLIPKDKLNSFAARHRPFYSKVKISQFAQRMQVHPGIVIGQLQHAREIPWTANREFLVKVRNLITTTAITDGWGKRITAKT